MDYEPETLNFMRGSVGTLAPGSRFVWASKPGHHMADRRGRYYYCNCVGGLVVDGRYLLCGKWPGIKSNGNRFHVSHNKRISLWHSLQRLSGNP